jgi:hypothetical protein
MSRSSTSWLESFEPAIPMRWVVNLPTSTVWRGGHLEGEAGEAFPG